MNKINNYEELVLERKKLEIQLAHHRSTIDSEIHELKQKLEPIKNVISFFSHAKEPYQNNKLLQAGTNLGIELFVRNKLLSKAGWLTKLVLPFILKKVSSKAIERVQAIRK